MTDTKRANKFNKNVVSYDEVYVGMKVIDNENIIGTVRQCFDEHNIWVVYDVGGSGFYCIKKNCKDYDPIYHY